MVKTPFCFENHSITYKKSVNTKYFYMFDFDNFVKYNDFSCFQGVDMTIKEVLLHISLSSESKEQVVFNIVNPQVDAVFICGGGDIRAYQSIETMPQNDKARFVGSVIGVDVKDAASLDDLIQNYIARQENDAMADRVITYHYELKPCLETDIRNIIVESAQILTQDTDERREKQAQRRAVKAYNHFQNCRKYNVMRNMSKNMRQRH